MLVNFVPKNMDLESLFHGKKVSQCSNWTNLKISDGLSISEKTDNIK